ncbi:MAG: hypothetical protein RR579_08550, partial [Eubacterium sp.]
MILSPQTPTSRFTPIHTTYLNKSGQSPAAEFVYVNGFIPLCPTCQSPMTKKVMTIEFGLDGAPDYVVNGLARELYFSAQRFVVVYIRCLRCEEPNCGRFHRELPPGVVPYSSVVSIILFWALRAFLLQESPGRSFYFLEDECHFYFYRHVKRLRKMCRVVFGVKYVRIGEIFGYLRELGPPIGMNTAKTKGCLVMALNEMIRIYGDVRYNFGGTT